MSSGSLAVQARRHVLLVPLAVGLGCGAEDDATSTSSMASTTSAMTSMTSTTATSAAPTTSDASTGATEASIELGTGLTQWQTLAEGDSIELVAGPQGGWHVDVSVRGEGLEPDGLWLYYEAVDPRDDSELSFVTSSLLSESSVLFDDEGWLRLGEWVVFDIEGPEDVVGTEVCLVVTAVGMDWEGEDRRCVTVVDELP